ncbi:MAG: bleomycin resistance protein [Proteobacteria bacterium]|nr:MAG: bleomycin resistance protein [Pseudomonadota bacterium]
MEINGIAHIQITVNDLQRAMPFYEKLLGFMGMQAVVKAPNFLYMIGGRTGIAITRASAENRHIAFDQRRIGLHHICFRARARDDVDELYRFLLAHDAKIVHPPEDGSWAPGYYSLLFEDPEGIRLEINYVPAQGWLTPGLSLPLKGMPGFDYYPE